MLIFKPGSLHSVFWGGGVCGNPSRKYQWGRTTQTRSSCRLEVTQFPGDPVSITPSMASETGQLASYTANMGATCGTERPFIRPSQKAARTLHLSTLGGVSSPPLERRGTVLGARHRHQQSLYSGPWDFEASPSPGLHTSGQLLKTTLQQLSPLCLLLPISYTDEGLSGGWHSEVSAC